MPSAKRAPHRKSRGGCVQCKHIHVKCDERKPTCARCARLGNACSYNAIPRLTTSESMASVSSVSDSPGSLITDQQPLMIMDLELYHRFIFSYKTAGYDARQFSNSEIHLKLVEVAYENHFLLHNCLALAALQLYQIDRSRIELFERACYLQGIAISQVQPVIANMTQEDAVAALVFSTYTAAFALAEYMLNPHKDETDPIDKILECFQLSRGVSLVASNYWPYLTTTWVTTTLPDTTTDKEKILNSLGDKYPTYLTVKSLALGQDDPERKKTCLNMIDEVFEYITRVLQRADREPQLAHLVDAFTVHLPAVFRDMLAERKPIALIILAYHAVLMSVTPKVWHLQGWPELLMTRITAVLGPDWSEFLDWPRKMIFAQEQRRKEPSVEKS